MSVWVSLYLTLGALLSLHLNNRDSRLVLMRSPFPRTLLAVAVVIVMFCWPVFVAWAALIAMMSRIKK